MVMDGFQLSCRGTILFAQVIELFGVGGLVVSATVVQFMSTFLRLQVFFSAG